jgi:hypothetical protein
MKPIKSCVIQIAGVNYEEHLRFDCQEIQHVDFVHRAIADMYIRRDYTSQAQQRVQFDNPLSFANGTQRNRLKHRSIFVAYKA